MNKNDLVFDYPSDLIALSPVAQSRVLLTTMSNGDVQEISVEELLDRFEPGETLLINDTKVSPRRVFAETGEEIVFIEHLADDSWSVLFPVRGKPVGTEYSLPGNVIMRLVKKGRPQRVSVSRTLDEKWFEEHGELPIPPYIQKARDQRHNLAEEESWYQTEWAEKTGSLAAPTASFHFKKNHLNILEKKGVEILKVTLHVGLGTFLPIHADNLAEHEMHAEYYSVEPEVARRIKEAKRLTTLGSTATRVAETIAASDFAKLQGLTNLFIYPPYEFKIVDRMLTNFHQPETTLFAMVCAFAGTRQAHNSYRHAIENKFRLFSYGDLSVWEK